MPITRQQDTPEIALQRFKNITQEDANEASYYLGECEGDLERALAAWKEDKDWNDTHYYPNSNECSSDLPLDDSTHVATKQSRRGCFKNFMISQKDEQVGVEGPPTRTPTGTTESWTIVEDDTRAPINVSTGVEMNFNPQYETNYEDNSDVYVVPANVSWKYPKLESAKSVKITDSILSIFGRKRSTSGNSSLLNLDEGNVDSMLRPLIDPSPGSRRQIS